MATKSDSTYSDSPQSQNLQPTHAQGPWDCDVAGQPIIINGPEDSDGRNVICTIEDADCMHGQYHYQPEVAAANARLISASPELLTVSRKAYRWLTGMSFTPAACKAEAENLMAEFETAIAKATGAAS